MSTLVAGLPQLNQRLQVPQPLLQTGELQNVSRIANGVWGKRLLMVNVYLIQEGQKFFLLDAGLPGTGRIIRNWVQRIIGPRKKLDGVLLTHGHFDHVGALPALALEWNAPIWAHASEQPFLQGRQSYPPPDPTVGRGLMSLLSPLYPKGPFHMGELGRTLPHDGSIPGIEEWRSIPTPGHAPGHVSFYRERDGVLLAGDAFNTTRQESLWHVLTQRLHLEGPPAYFTPDWGGARDSVRRLASLQVRVAAVGHGRALHGAAPMRCLDYLASHFDEIGLPCQGRYLVRPSRWELPVPGSTLPR